MKICTWNINGLRALRPSFAHFLSTLDTEIFCVQETKISRDIDEASAVIPGFNSYFSFSRIKAGYSGVAVFCKDPVCPIWAEEGLTGLLNSDSPISPPSDVSSIFSRESPSSIDALCDKLDCSRSELLRLDSEGRSLQLCFRVRSRLVPSAPEPASGSHAPSQSSSFCSISQSPLEAPEPLPAANVVELEPTRPFLTLICVYCIRADPTDSVRQQAKLQFYELLQWRARRILASGLSNVVIVGDMNVAHREIDSCDPEKWEDFTKTEPRKWMDQFVVLDPTNHRPFTQSDLVSASESTCSFTGEFVDVFRFHHPDERDAYTNWCTLTGARANNYGTRIDYILADRSLYSASPSSRNCWLRRDVMGSDHCPVLAEFALAFDAPPPRPPPLCARFMPEFGGGCTQLKLSAFFSGAGSTLSKDRDRERERTLKSKFDSSGISTSSACLDLTSEDSDSKCSNSDKSRASQQQNQAAVMRDPPPRANQTQAVKRKASGKAAGASAAAHTKITTFFDRVSQPQRLRNASADAAAPVAARASDRSCSSSSTATTPIPETETATLSEQTDSAPLSLSPSGNGEGQRRPFAAAESHPTPTKRPRSQDASSSSPNTNQSDGSAAASAASSQSQETADARSAWQRLLTAPSAPLCRHGEPSVKRQVKKEGPNRGRYFWCCERSAGREGDPAARCGFFQWCQK